MRAALRVQGREEPAHVDRWTEVYLGQRLGQACRRGWMMHQARGGMCWNGSRSSANAGGLRALSREGEDD